MKKSGRPGKNDENRACKEAILEATASLIEEIGADAVTVRKVIVFAKNHSMGLRFRRPFKMWQEGRRSFICT